MGLTPDEELDAAMAAVGIDTTFSQAVLEGVAVVRPTLVADLAARARIAADRLAAARQGAIDLTADEIGRLEALTGSGALQLAGAAYGMNGDPEYARVAQSDARLGRSLRANAETEAADATTGATTGAGSPAEPAVVARP